MIATIHRDRVSHARRRIGCLVGGGRCAVAGDMIRTLCWCGSGNRLALVKQTNSDRRRGIFMAKDAIVSQELADKFKTEKDSPYLRFVRAEGLDTISAQYVPNLRTVEVKPWARRNGRGVFIKHEAARASNDCYVCEIPPGKKLEPHHHVYE